MKNFAALACVAAVVSGLSLSEEAEACERNNRVVYARTSYIVHAKPIVKPAPKPTPVAVATAELKKNEIVVVKKKLVEIEYGSVVTAKVRFAGQEEGEVTIQSGNLELQCPVLEWSPSRVTFQLPDIETPYDSEVTLTIFKSTGAVAKRVEALILSDADFKVQPSSPSITRGPAADLK